MVNECEYVLVRDTYIHREVHGALFVQTINDVAQGHHAQFAQISIVVIITIIIIKCLLG
jgi:hypothetical protein